MKQKRRQIRLKIAIALSLAFIWLVLGCFQYINNPKIQSIIFASINKVSSLNIVSASVKLDILKREVSITDIHLFSVSKNQRFKTGKAAFKFRILPLLRGKIKIKDLRIQDLKIELGKHVKFIKGQKKRIGLANLLIVRNISVENGEIDKVDISMPNGSFSVDRVKISFTPSFLGDIKLSLDVSKSKYSPKNGEGVEAEEIVIAGHTDVNNWIDIFPYVDDIRGSLSITNLKYDNLIVNSLDAKIKYTGRKLSLDKLTAAIDGNKIGMKGEVNGQNGKYNLDINIEEPIYLPSLGRESAFANTSGYIDGKISIEGKGLDYKTTNASANITLSHRVDKKNPLPAELTAKIDVKDGAASTNGAILKAGENTVIVNGSLNYIKPHIDLTFTGENIPVESVLNRFKTKHYHPTYGVANVTGKFSGWKPNLKFDLSVDASPAGYYEMAAYRAKMDLMMTYNQMELAGKIIQREKEVANVDLKMKMGEKLSDGTRHKTFDLKVDMDDIDLTPVMEAYDLKGTGTGTMRLSGTPENFTGTGHAKIESGEFKGVSFQIFESDLKFSKKQIVFSEIKLATTETNPYTFPNPVTMDITDYGLRFHGTPRPNFSVDAKYTTGQGNWQITKVSYASLANPDWVSDLSGSISSDGNLNLGARGTFDTSLLSSLRGIVREARGPAELKNVKIGGTSLDPTLSGEMILNDNTVQLRNWGYYIDKINGTLVFSGHKISMPSLEGRIEYGDFKLSGTVTHNEKEISNVDIKFDGKSIMYASKDRTFRMEVDCNLDLKGGPKSSNLGGNVNILDGKYTKKFSIFEKMKAAPVYEDENPDKSAWTGMKLDLKVKTGGDLMIDNNIGEIWLNADLIIRGTVDKPKFVGNVVTVGGEIKYAGLDFEVTRGFVEFMDPYNIPFVELVAAKEVGRYNVELVVRGRTNKLLLDLNSTPPLDRKDILALLTFGITEEDLRSARFGYQFGSGLVAEQITSILEKPVTKFTPLDSFRIETSPTGDEEVTRLYMGKDISDRLRINFITDINSANAQQMFQAEYMITDFMLLKGTGTSNAQYRFNLTFRFREQ